MENCSTDQSGFSFGTEDGSRDESVLNESLLNESVESNSNYGQNSF